jgi:protein-tyrosine phosphatase
VYQVDDEGQLFVGPVIDDWKAVTDHGIDTIVDLEGGLDIGVPTIPNQCLYVYFPIDDGELPNLSKLRALGHLGASLVRSGHRVLAHCGMGFNRSALVAGVILHELGFSGPDTVVRLRSRRQGALFNDKFAEYLESLGDSGP